MTQEEKARAYDEALKRARKQRDDYQKELNKADKNSQLAGLLRAGISAIELAFPELHESEDERIRKAIIRGFENCKRNGIETFNNTKIDDILVYLEKQKEIGIQWLKSDNVKNPDTPYIDKAGMFYTTDGRMCYASDIEKQKEQKPIKWTDLTWKDIVELEGIINNVHYDFRNGIGQESFGKEVLERFREYKGDEHLDEIEQKPVRWSDNFEENIRTLLHDKLTWHSEDGRMSSTVFIDNKTLKDIISGIWFYVGKEALKYPNKELNVTGYSEEDEEIIYSLRSFLIQAQQSGGYGSIQIVQIEKCLNWLKSLPERFNLEPKPEWNDEDERKYQCIRNILLTDMDKKVGSWKYSEILEWYEKRGIGRYTNYKPSWKPSEDQMDALKVTLEYMPDTFKPRCTLMTLQNDLEKLM